MKIILINPPSPYLANDLAYPPSGLMYIASSLESFGHTVEILDLSGGVEWERIVPYLKGDVFGITCVTPNFYLVQKIASLLPVGARIILGGVHPTFLPEDTLANIRCDAVIRGEGESIINQVVEDILSDSSKKIYNGGIVEIEKIPKPARHLLDLHRYRPGGEELAVVYSSRGCPFNCAFCSKITGRSYRLFPVAKVMEEVQELITMGFNRILFGDDDIGININLKELLYALKPHNIKFRLNQDAKTLNREIVRLAAEAGCYEISFGIETGSQKMLSAMKKKASVQDNKQAIVLAKEYGIRVKAYFLVNFPGETEETIEETIRFAKEARPDKWLLSAFVPLPGSDTFLHPRKYGITWMSKNWQDYYLVGKDGTFSSAFLAKDLTFDKQNYLHDTLYLRLKEILG